jgi:hypothetical protein
MRAELSDATARLEVKIFDAETGGVLVRRIRF